MPKFEPKHVQKDLESRKLWPVYWIYGDEPMKARELLKRIRRALFETEVVNPFSETQLEGQEVSTSQILDASQSISMLGGARLTVVKNAHLVREVDTLDVLLKPQSSSETVASVTVFFSKDLDQRKKFSKKLIEKAAVVACEAIHESDREAWVQYLAKKLQVELQVNELSFLSSLDPWSLDIIERELEKLRDSPLNESRASIIAGSVSHGNAEDFIESFFNKKLNQAMSHVQSFADYPEEALPLLGLMTWNTRMLALFLKNQETTKNTKELKLGSFLQEKFNRYSKIWNLSQILELQKNLAELDFSIKQTSRPSLGLWSQLVIRHCSH